MINIEVHGKTGMEGNQIWYNRAWLYSDRYIGDFGFKKEFRFIREALDRKPIRKPHIRKNSDTEGNTNNT